MKARRANENARRQPGVDAAKAKDYTPDYESIKAALQSGRDLRLVDYPPEQRSAVIGIVASLRDDLPIRAGWQTIRESHLSETRLRARRYFIPGEFLREASDAS